MVAAWLSCHGCGGRFDPMSTLALACPRAVPGDGIDHVLEPVIEGRRWPLGQEDNPFLRYRSLSLAATMLDDERLSTVIEELDLAVQQVDGRGFRITPWAWSSSLSCMVKDETGNVAGSHKGRHLFGLMIYLRVLEHTGRMPQRPPLAIASCGNAALAAAVVARAARWPLQVFVPTDADPAVLDRLATLGAHVQTCPRAPDQPGDPAVYALRQALAAGALPFTVQGDACGISVEGGRTLSWELCDQGELPDVLYVQVGGGALASAVWQGLRDARQLGRISHLPRLVLVQTDNAHPLARAWRRLDGQDLSLAARDRARFMWPWEQPPHSVAHGILDDETYDWWACCEGLRATGGEVILVDEQTLVAARDEARAAGFSASATGTAALAGLRAHPPPKGERAGVLVTGRG